MPVPLIKENKRKTKRGAMGGGTIKATTHLPDRHAEDGHEERLASFIKRTLQLKRDGYHYHEIGPIIASEYKLEVIPHFTTVAKWRRQGMNAFDKDILDLANQMRMDQWEELESMKSKWLPIATAQALEIRRWKMVEGSLQPEMDEDALKEQLEATKQVVSICAAQAKLFGLNMEQAIASSGDGPESLQALQLWMVGQINIQGAPTGGVIDINPTNEILELKSGIPEVDAV